MYSTSQNIILCIILVERAKLWWEISEYMCKTDFTKSGRKLGEFLRKESVILTGQLGNGLNKAEKSHL